MGPLNIVLWLAGVALIGIGYTRARAPVDPLPGAQGAGRECRPLRGVARWRPRRQHDRCVGRDGDPPSPGADRRRDRDRRCRPGLPRVPDPLSARLRRAARLLAPGDPPPLDRGAAIHHDLEPAVVGDLGGVPGDDAELEPQDARPGRDGLVGVGTHSSERRKTSTMSKRPVSATAAASVGKAGTPSTSRSFGLIGMHSNPCWTR